MNFLLKHEHCLINAMKNDSYNESRLLLKDTLFGKILSFKEFYNYISRPKTPKTFKLL